MWNLHTPPIPLGKYTVVKVKEVPSFWDFSKAKYIDSGSDENEGVLFHISGKPFNIHPTSLPSACDVHMHISLPHTCTCY